MPSSHLPSPLQNILQVDQWFLASVDAGIVLPIDVSEDVLTWQAVSVPGTVASVLLSRPLRGADTYPEIDGRDWVYRQQFVRESCHSLARYQLNLQGLAGIAEIWLNGIKLFESHNMFCAYQLDISKHMQEQNELLLLFRSVDGYLKAKQPRPRWKTKLVDHQNLRYLRRTLLGRIPGWTPSIPAVGPWQPVSIHELSVPFVQKLQVKTLYDGMQARVNIEAEVYLPPEYPRAGSDKFRFCCEINSCQQMLPANLQGNILRIQAELPVQDVVLWWPHTHGDQGSNPLVINLENNGEKVLCVAERNVAFKKIAFVSGQSGSALVVNEQEIFVRGACWTVNDIATLQHDDSKVRAILHHMKAAGMNMLRIGGTMLYEHDALYQACDELGIMVWQDFMFANMDYPFDDPVFSASVEQEVQQQLRRLSNYACVSVYCGGSEIEQQAAMTGVESAQQKHRYLAETLPALCEHHHPGIPYFCSSPTGGAMPFYTSEGICHYYGVGAYLRDVSDVFIADVQFASECLAFSHIPNAAHLKTHFTQCFPPPHHPHWKAGVCRDNGAGWDFEDVRDHYIKTLFHLDPIALRYHDLERYYAISEVVTGELMSQVFQFWRSTLSRCSGGLVWFLNDIVPGGGWGLIDSDGVPKPALEIVANTLQPVQVVLVNKGLEGFWLDALNETGESVEGTIVVQLWKDNAIELARGERQLKVPAGCTQGFYIEELLGHFYDSANAYRFGPVRHQVVSCKWLSADGKVLSQAVAYSSSMDIPKLQKPGVTVDLTECGKRWALRIESDSFLQNIDIQIKGFDIAKNRFHVLPHQVYNVDVYCEKQPQRIRGQISSLNSESVFPIVFISE